MSTIPMKTLMTIAAIAALLETCAAASTRVYHYKTYHAPRTSHGYVYRSRGYYGSYPNEDLIIRQPGTGFFNTDPDSSVRAYMRRDNIGPNGTPGSCC
jgi:hypothetical protein